MRKTFFTLLLAFGVMIALSAAASASPSAGEILKEVKETIEGLGSFSYLVKEEDYQDEILKERVSVALESFKEDAKQVSAALGDERDLEKEVEREQIKSGIYGIRFVRPYMREMVILKSGYIPDTIHFLKNATLFYRPDVDPELIYMKSRSGLILFQPIKELETGGFFTMTCWLYDVLEADYLIEKGGKLSLAGEEELEEGDTWVLQIDIRDNPSLDRPFAFTEEEYGIPEQVRPRIDRELDDMKRRIRLHKQGTVKYWVDKKKYLILKKEILFGGKCIVRTTMSKVKTNNLEKDDISTYKLKGKKTGKKQ